MSNKNQTEAINSLVKKCQLNCLETENNFRAGIKQLLETKETVKRIFFSLPDEKSRKTSEECCLQSINEAIAGLVAMTCRKEPSVDYGLDAGKFVILVNGKEEDILEELMVLTGNL